MFDMNVRFAASKAWGTLFFQNLAVIASKNQNSNPHFIGFF